MTARIRQTHNRFMDHLLTRYHKFKDENADLTDYTINGLKLTILDVSNKSLVSHGDDLREVLMDLGNFCDLAIMILDKERKVS